MKKVVALLALSLVACTSSKTTPRAQVSAGSSSPAAPIREKAPLQGEWLEVLGEAGTVAIPLGAREPRPVVVAVHGAEARPDWVCGPARASLGPYPFIVCPHSAKKHDIDASWYSAANLRWQIEKSMADLKERFGDYVSNDPPTYFGHSQGAMLAPDALAVPGPTRFGNAIFFEGLPKDAWKAKRELMGSGINRLLLVSGQPGWAAGHDQFAKSFSDTSIAAKHVHLDTGHFFNDQVFQTLRRERSFACGTTCRE